MFIGRAWLRVVVLLIAIAATRLAAQVSSSHPILLPSPSNAAAPAASARVYSDGGLFRVTSVAIDSQENVYVGGSANDLVQLTDFPAIYGRRPSADGDAVIAKFDRTGRPLWASFFGGNDARRSSRLAVPDTVLGLAVDAAGQVHAAGSTTSTNLPIVGGFQSQPGSASSGSDGFFFKLSADGQRVLYSTYYGSSDGGTAIHGVHVGPSGDVWLAASTGAGSLFTTQDLSGGNGRVVILKLNTAGSPVWSTRLGLLQVEGFAVDGAGDPYVAGLCTSACVPEWTPALSVRAVMRLTSTGSQLRSTVGIVPGNSTLTSLALGLDGRIYVAGTTRDPALPVRNAWQPRHGSGNNEFPSGDAFFAILNASNSVETLSYLGGFADDTGSRPSITPMANGEFAVAINADSNDLPGIRALVDHHVDGPVYRSLNRGISWQVAGRMTQPSTAVLDVSLDPHRQVIYAAAGGLIGTRDLGNTWQLEPRGLFAPATDRLVFDPRQPGAIYAAMAGNVYRYDEAQAAWVMVLRSLPGAYLKPLAVSPHDSSVWAAGNFGLEVSTNGGASWSRRDQGLPAYQLGPPGGRVSPNVIAFHPTDRQTVYAGAGFGVYVSTDAGGNWQPLVTGTPAPDVTGIAFDPIRPQLMHYATRNGGLLRCEDGGRTCVRHLSDHSLTAVATDPQKRHIVYAAGLGPDGRPSFHLSIDHGDTWHRSMDGLNMRGLPMSLLVDQRDSSRLYIGNAAHSAVPYIVRFRPTTPGASTYTAEFASYLASANVQGMAATASGDLILGLNQTLGAFAGQLALARIGR